MRNTSDADGRGSGLTPRQREVLRLQAYGMNYDEISRHLGLSVWTVKNHHKQAVRALQISLTVYPSERVRTTLACYILGLLDGGSTPMEIVERLRMARQEHPALASPDVIDEDADDQKTAGDAEETFQAKVTPITAERATGPKKTARASS